MHAEFAVVVAVAAAFVLCRTGDVTVSVTACAGPAGGASVGGVGAALVADPAEEAAAAAVELHAAALAAGNVATGRTHHATPRT